MNESIVHHILQAAVDNGVTEFIICAGMRNSPFVEALRLEKRFQVYYWPEERSAGFFAFGRTCLTKHPVAIIVTSGTAAAELLPSVINAYYYSLPLLVITADRPPYFRGSGAPQSIEQVGLFSHYTTFSQDVTDQECLLEQWNQQGPAHLNICLNEPQSEPHQGLYQIKTNSQKVNNRGDDLQARIEQARGHLDDFFSKVKKPLIVVAAIPEEAQKALIPFLVALGAPLFLEGISGIREAPLLQHLRIRRVDKVLESATQADYPIDGILRIGHIPTHRIWRDLEYLKDKITLCHITETPFSGISWDRSVIPVSIQQLILHYQCPITYSSLPAKQWIAKELEFEAKLLQLFIDEPAAEASLVHQLSAHIPQKAHIYLGNSLPVREWDMAATSQQRHFHMTATRGSVNGIDGQISTFLGLSQHDRENWAIIGDLTALYDMVGPWILQQLPSIQTNIVIINNGGGKIFERFSPHKEMLNCHQLNFKPLAEMWGLAYSLWKEIPPISSSKNKNHQLIEIVPDDAATQRFWDKYHTILVDNQIQLR